MAVTLYLSTVSSNLETKKHQQKIQTVLDSKKIKYDIVDISSNDDAKTKMRAIADNPSALPPQISNGDQYCGDYNLFEEALEQEGLYAFLKL